MCRGRVDTAKGVTFKGPNLVKGAAVRRDYFKGFFFIENRKSSCCCRLYGKLMPIKLVYTHVIADVSP